MKTVEDWIAVRERAEALFVTPLGGRHILRLLAAYHEMDDLVDDINSMTDAEVLWTLRALGKNDAA